MGDNPRGTERDREKLAYERGLIAEEDLQQYDPVNDWDTLDSAFAITISPADVVYLTPSICAEVDDGNTRSRNLKMLERGSLMRHVEDFDDWGSTAEELPALGVNEGPRKACSKCKRSRGLQYFYGNPRSRDGLHSWCKNCLKSNNKSGKKAS